MPILPSKSSTKTTIEWILNEMIDELSEFDQETLLRILLDECCDSSRRNAQGEYPNIFRRFIKKGTTK
jgi:hypothetical protein